MNESLSSLSDAELSKLISESQSTIRRTEASTKEVFDRVRKFSELYGELSIKPEGVALLYQEPGDASVHCRPLDQKLVVGRLPKSERNPTACDLAFDDAQMSRTHFEITLVDGFYVLRDLESRNGTYVNDNPERVRDTLLKSGDIIFAGSMGFVFTGG